MTNNATNFLNWCDDHGCNPSATGNHFSVNAEHLTGSERSELWALPGYKVTSASWYTVWLTRVK